MVPQIPSQKDYTHSAMLVKKAIVLSKRILSDPEMNLSETEKVAYVKFEGSNRTLAPNTTAICQPLDAGIGATIKGKLRTILRNGCLTIGK